MAIGRPGNPAPVPTSITVLAFFTASDLKAFIQSIKCFLITSSSSVIAVRFIFSFHSCKSFIYSIN